jgi:hypothetical protein
MVSASHFSPLPCSLLPLLLAAAVYTCCCPCCTTRRDQTDITRDPVAYYSCHASRCRTSPATCLRRRPEFVDLIAEGPCLVSCIKFSVAAARCSLHLSPSPSTRLPSNLCSLSLLYPVPQYRPILGSCCLFPEKPSVVTICSRRARRRSLLVLARLSVLRHHAVASVFHRR